MLLLTNKQDNFITTLFLNLTKWSTNESQQQG
uniref:Uncharacterized protein n=1 Tax=Arundo donax TaxID=35708 RepID=A0A0A9HBS3_ARUDO